jgi:hypothetical protein
LKTGSENGNPIGSLSVADYQKTVNGSRLTFWHGRTAILTNTLSLPNP